MSATRWKDELIRVATVLGLPDDVDATTIADKLQERLEDTTRRLENGDTIRAQAEADRNRYAAGLNHVVQVMDREALDLGRHQGRAGSPQASAAMIAAATRLTDAALVAREALAGPAA